MDIICKVNETHRYVCCWLSRCYLSFDINSTSSKGFAPDEELIIYSGDLIETSSHSDWLNRTMIGQWKGKVGLEVSEREEEREEDEGSKGRMKMEPDGLEKPQVTRCLIAGEYICIVKDLPNVDI